MRELEGADLCGYVLKKGSPSCGMERVKVYTKGPAARTGRGLFAEALMERFPLLPVEEEGRLNDPRLRENFIERVFAYRPLKDLFGSRWTMGDLVRFHTGEKLLVLAHDPAAYRVLGRLVAAAKGQPRAEVSAGYGQAFLRGLAKLATRGLVPLVVPLTLFGHHVRRHGVAWLQGQTYLEPHPKELMLRNHV